MHYSAKWGGFYDAALRGDYEASGSWPPDAVEVGAEEYEALLAAQGGGKRISAAPDGRPVAVDQPDRSIVVRRAEILARLTDLDLVSVRPLRAVAAGAATDDDRAKLTSIEVEASALRAELAANSPRELKTLTEETSS